MKVTYSMVFWFFIPLLCLPGLLCADGEPLTAAVLNFNCRDKELSDTANLIRQLVEVDLGSVENLILVSRDELDRILEEQTKGLAGLSDSAVPSVGRLLGAGAMIAGSVFKVQDEIYATAKVFGTETGRTFAVKAKGNLTGVEAIAETLGKEIGEIVAANRDEFRNPVVVDKDQLEELKQGLAGKKLPVVFVSFQERTLGLPTIDPAVQTEFEYILRKCGFEIQKDQEGDLKKWLEKYRFGDGNAAPPSSEKVDLVIHGEGMSEFASRNSDLVSFRGRVEVEVLDTKTGKVLLADRETTTSVDLSSHIVAKSVLQKAAATLAYRNLVVAVDDWNSVHP